MVFFKKSQPESKIQICLTEYSEFRNEVKLIRQQQITILATAMTTICLTIGFALTLFGIQKQFQADTYPAIEFLLYVVVPGISTFFALLWLDQVYRQLCIATYTRQLEEYFREVTNSEKNSRGCYIPGGYELYLVNIANSPPTNTYRIYYYICIGAFLVLPILSFIAGFLLIESNAPGQLFYMCLPVGILIYAIGLFFGATFVRKILKLF